MMSLSGESKKHDHDIDSRFTSNVARKRRWGVGPLLLSCLALTSRVLADDLKPPDIMLGLNASGHNGHVTRLVIDKNRSQLISVSHDKTIRFWDLTTFATLRVLRPPIGRGIVGELYSASLSPDGAWLAVSGSTAPEGTTDHSVLLISLPDGKLVRRLKGNTLPVQDIAFSPDGRWLAAAGTDGILRLWDTTTWELVRSYPGHTARIDSLAWSPDSTRLITASWDTTCRFWSLTDNTSTAMVAHGGRQVLCVAWSPDGRTVATGGSDRWVKLWEPNGQFRMNLVSGPEPIETISFSPDSSKLIYGYGGSQLRPLAAGMVRLTDNVVGASYYGHLDMVLCSTFSPDGKYAIIGDCDDHICVWEADTGRLVARLRSEGWPIYATGFSPDGRSLGFGFSHFPGSSLLATNPLTRSFTVDQLAFGPTPDASYMRAQTNWGPLSIHRTSERMVTVSQSGTPISTYSGQNLTIHSRTLLPGNRAAIGLAQSVIVFDALNGKPIYRLPGHLDDVWAVTPSPDQRHLLTGSDDEIMQIWNLERYEHTLSLYIAGEDWVAWTPQGYYAASPGGENMMGWHMQRGFNDLATFYPASRFRKRFYRPEVIRRVLSAGGPMQALKELERASGTEIRLTDVKNNLPPQVSVMASPFGVETEGKFKVQVTATPMDGDNIKSLKVLIDGRPAAETRDDEALEAGPAPDSVASGRESKMTWELTLTAGPHRLAAVADSERSVGLSEPLSVTVGSPIANRPRLFVLSIGVGANQRADLRRRFASTDALAIGQAFTNYSNREFSDVQVRVVTDPLVTRLNLEESFRWLEQSLTPDDVGVIYFAGTALRDQQDTIYFQHHESRFGDPAAGLPDHILRGYLKRTRGRLLLILDLMERDENAQIVAGLVNPTPLGFGERRSSADLIRQLASEDYGIAVLATTTSVESNADASVVNSPFARSIVDGLSGRADTNSNGVVDVKELIQFVRSDVKQRTSGTQNPAGVVAPLIPAFTVSRRR